MSKYKPVPIICFACGYNYRTARGRKRMMIGMPLGPEKQVFCGQCAKGLSSNRGQDFAGVPSKGVR